jgi:hypothetical protein
MSYKGLLKFGAAVVLLAIVLIFLGVNFVPRIFALSPPQQNLVDAVKLIRPNYVNELYPRAIKPQLLRSDYADELYPRAIKPQLPRSDYADELYPRAIRPQLFRSDYLDERYPRAIMP